MKNKERLKRIRAILKQFNIVGDEKILVRRMMSGDIWFLFTDSFNVADPNEVLKRLVEDGLLIIRWEREGNPANVSGYDWERTRTILMKEPMFADFINHIERSFHIRNGWVCEYLGPGRMAYHPDGGYRGGFRLVVTIFQTDKRMSFRVEGKEVTVNLSHGTGVLLSDYGGGVIDKSIEHCVHGAYGSIFIALDIFPKKRNR